MRGGDRKTRINFSPYITVRIIAGITVSPLAFSVFGEYLYALIVIAAVVIYLHYGKVSKRLRENFKHFYILALLSTLFSGISGALAHEYPEMKILWIAMWLIPFSLLCSYLMKVLSQLEREHE